VLALAIALPPPDAALNLVVMGGFTAGLTLAGARIVSLTARAALEAHAGAEARWHRDALAAAHAQLRAAHEEAEALSALIVHDLRNPLASVHANLETLQDDLPPGRHPSREAAEIALAEVRRVTGMTQDLLLVARLERREVRAAAAVVVSDLVDEVARAMRPVVARSGASLSVALSPAAPLRIAVEAALVRRALDNLVVNAARHVGPGDRVALAVEPGADGGLRLAVRNSGPAVPPEARARLFEKHGGGLRWDSSGLGLYLCRLVAARHGGSIALVDRPGWSVSFELSLPAAAMA
jgi:signal transduction histidine kinase